MYARWVRELVLQVAVQEEGGGLSLSLSLSVSVYLCMLGGLRELVLEVAVCKSRTPPPAVESTRGFQRFGFDNNFGAGLFSDIG